jgi:hypothetical protein
MQDDQANSRSARCQKCRSDMTHVTDLPHPLAPNMLKSMFVCRTCNQTRTYILPACQAVPDPAPGVAAA